METHMHFMGIGGQGISAVAQMARAAGNIVTGCDRQESATTRSLVRAGIPVQIGHSTEHLEGFDTLVISPAVTALDARNPELLAAQERGMQIITWQELLGGLMHGKCVLSVSGVHGKGTTTAMLSLVLVDAGLDPTCEIGAVVPRFGTNFRSGKSQYFVNEADEFNHNFWHYHPRLAIVTSIEFEHPEFFSDYEAFIGAFVHFIRGMDLQGDWPLPPTLIVNANSAGCMDLCTRLIDWPGHIVTYSVVSDRSQLPPQGETWTRFEAYDMKLDGETSFRVRTGEVDLLAQSVQLQLPGVHNIENALAAFTAAYVIGVDTNTIVTTLEGFGGIRRRFEIRYQGPLQLKNGYEADVVLIDDYAHHPTAIAATLTAARRRYPGRRLIAVYQPHMYSRTKTFFEQFLQSFDVADIAMIADIFPAREQDTGIVHARDLIQAMTQRPHFAQGYAQALYSGDPQETAQMLRTTLRSNDIVLIMGAGDIYTVTEMLLQQAAVA